jgi:hypothetical protein
MVSSGSAQDIALRYYTAEAWRIIIPLARASLQKSEE